MKLRSLFRSVLKYRKTNLSLLLLITYSIIAILYVFDHQYYKLNLPKQDEQPEFNELLETAWTDLQIITASFHPYTSRENDKVHDYLLERVLKIARNASFASVSDDSNTKRSILFQQKDAFNAFSDVSRVTYFESSNILVKLEGKKPDEQGLLLSAHFDSVPTGRGATDDGMGVASLLANLEYHIKHRPDRTLIFNFNNNEEFGLLGASAYFDHPWSSLTKYVINLEGTGAGGKAVLFRTTDTSTAKIYQQSVKENPFGNSIYQQGFYSTYVRSETDYKIYEENGMRGWDIAFYKPRNIYHTMKDSIQYTSKASLWHMLHTSLQLSSYIVSNSLDTEDQTPACFFDLVGLKFFVMSAKTLFYWNCVFLLISPIVAISLYLISCDRMTWKSHSWLSWMRFPLSLVFGIVVQKLFSNIIIHYNCLTFSRNYFWPISAFFTIVVLADYILINCLNRFSPCTDMKSLSIIELFIMLWAILLFTSKRLYTSNYRYTGLYPFSILFVLTTLAAMLRLLTLALRPKAGKRHDGELVDRHSRYSSHSQINVEEGNHGTIQQFQNQLLSSQDEEESTHEDNASTTLAAPSLHVNDGQVSDSEPPQHDERAPLLKGSSDMETSSKPEYIDYAWILQFLVIVPIASFILFSSVDAVMDAVNQTVQEGSKATFDIIKFGMVGSILIALPILPFFYKVNYMTISLTVLLFLISISKTLLEPSFTNNNPLKVRFSQNIDLVHGNGANVHVLGREGDLLKPMLEDLPSIKFNSIPINCTSVTNGMELCTYDGIEPNLLTTDGETDISNMLKVHILHDNRNSTDRSPYEPIVAELLLEVKENRACTLLFNSESHAKSPVREITVYQDKSSDSQHSNSSKSIKIASGVDELQLHKLDFDRQAYHIGVQWFPKILTDGDLEDDNLDTKDELTVSISCYWGEYDSDSVVNGTAVRKIPAFDELLNYSPLSFSFTNEQKGLVIVKDVVSL
ncbi:YBR074W [Saccharomyces arboricola H-6]|uniref:Peptide hydrolase n=1 Tax=Saccharomyces arboricola (strain H-6 / AS 2.3317 / CBS 10644) TaxID=1160507 RepID=J8QB36_SACAR|nr:YBR074W [Saccharomyces arboricola H-6]